MKSEIFRWSDALDKFDIVFYQDEKTYEGEIIDIKTKKPVYSIKESAVSAVHEKLKAKLKELCPNEWKEGYYE